MVVFVIVEAPRNPPVPTVTTDSSSNYFSLASKHFNATSVNELVLFSRSSTTFLRPVPPLFIHPFRFSSTLFSNVCAEIPTGLLPTAGPRARIISIVRTAIIHRAKKIIKCL